jgi:hypothetical protein
MSLAVRNLGTGKLNLNAEATAGPAAGKSWIVKSIMITNRETTVRSVDLRVRYGTGGTSLAYITPKDLVIPPATTVIVDDEITLMNPVGTLAADLQKLSTQAIGSLSSSEVDVVVNGMERDV